MAGRLGLQGGRLFAMLVIGAKLRWQFHVIPHPGEPGAETWENNSNTYGRATAIDLNKGDRVWMVADGDGPRDNPAIKALNLPPLGQAVRSSAIVTRTLLFVTEGDQINPRTPPGGGGKKFRALDKATGRTLWEVELEAGANGAPMTYLFNGKQYVVLAIGGQRHAAELVALSLP